MNKGRIQKTKDLFSKNAFFNFFSRISNAFSNKLRHSKTAGIFLSYFDFEEKYNRSITKKVFEKITLKKNKKLIIKNKIQYFVENSYFYKLFLRLVNTLLSMKVRTLGVALFIWGFCSVSVGFIKTYVATFVDNDFLLIYQGIALVVFAVPLLAGKSELGFLLANGKITGFIIRDLIEVKKERVVREGGAENTVVPVFLGLLLGISSIFFDPLKVIGIIFALVYIAVVFYKPEFGVAVAVASIPFASPLFICAEIICVTLAFLIKVMRGKRSIHFGTLDIAVFFFALFVLLRGAFSADFLISAKLFSYILIYFLITNLVKTRAMLYKLLGFMLISFFISACYGVAQNFFDVSNILSPVFRLQNGGVTSFFESPRVFGQFASLVLPLSFSLFAVGEKADKKFCYFMTIAVGLISLVFTSSRATVFATVLSVLIYFMIVNRRVLVASFFAIFLLVVCVPLMPESVQNVFAGMSDITSGIDTLEVGSFERLAEILKNFWIVGIGVGDKALSEVFASYNYTHYQLNAFVQMLLQFGVLGLLAFVFAVYLCISKFCTWTSFYYEREIKLLSGASLAGIMSLFVQGLFINVFHSPQIFVTFFAVAGILSASINCTKKEYKKVLTLRDVSGGNDEKTEIEISL